MSGILLATSLRGVGEEIKK